MIILHLHGLPLIHPSSWQGLSRCLTNVLIGSDVPSRLYGFLLDLSEKFVDPDKIQHLAIFKLGKDEASLNFLPKK